MRKDAAEHEFEICQPPQRQTLPETIRGPAVEEFLMKGVASVTSIHYA
jgi:hypothetical protein